MANREATWTVNLEQASGDKSVPRSAVRGGLLSEANGADGSLQGGVRPYNGFRKVWELQFDAYDSTDTTVEHYADAQNRDQRSEVTDIFPVTFMRGNSATCYGWVYRAIRNNDATKADVFIEYYDTGTKRWYTPNDPAGPGGSGKAVNYTAQLLMLECSPTDDMEVQTLGRIVYVFMKGRSPSIFHLDADNTPDTSTFNGSTVIGVTGDTTTSGTTGIPGPGFQPTLLDLDQNLTLGGLPKPSTAAAATTDRTPGEAQIVQSNKSAEDLLEQFSLTQPTFGLDDLATTPTVALREQTQLPAGTGGTTNLFYSNDNFGTGGSLDIESGVRLVVVVHFRATAVIGATPSNTLRKGNNTANRPGCEVDFVDNNTGTPAKLCEFEIPSTLSGSLDPISGGMCAMDIADSGTINETEVFTYSQVFESPSFSNLKTAAFGGTGSNVASTMHVRVVPKTADGSTLSVSDLSVSVYRISGLAEGPSCVAGDSSNTDNPGGVSYRSVHSQASGSVLAGGDPYTSSEGTGSDDYPLVGSGSLFSIGFKSGIAGTQYSHGSVTNPNVRSSRKTKHANSTIISAGFYRTRRENTDSSTQFGNTTQYRAGITANQVTNDGEGGADLFAFPSFTSTTLKVAERFSGTIDSATYLDNTVTVAQLLQAQTTPSGTIRQGEEIDDQFGIPSTTSANPDGTGANELQMQSHFNNVLFEVKPGLTSYVPGSSTTYSGSDTEVLNFLSAVINPKSPPDNALRVSTTIENLQWLVQAPEPINSNVSFDIYWSDPESGDGETLVKVNPASISSSSFNIADLYSGTNVIPSGRTFRWAVIMKTNIGGVTYQNTSGIFSFTTDDIFKSHKFERGNYAFAYQLFDSKTGRTSAMSEIARIDKGAFKLGTTGRCGVSGREYDQENEGLIAEITSPQVVPKGIPEYTCVELIYDTDKYDYAFFYRSPRTEDEAINFAPSTLFLDKMIKLDDYKTLDNEATSKRVNTLKDLAGSPADTNRQRIIFFYSLNEDEILYRPLYTGPTRFDDSMPQTGTAKFLDNILVTSNIVPPDNLLQANQGEFTAVDSYRGGGETKFSQVDKYAAELFPPQNQYTPSDPANRIIALVKVGPNMVGFSNDRMYHIRREGTVMVRELYEGMVGVVNPHAVGTAASQIFAISNKGVKIVGTNGSLDNMAVIDTLIKDKWKDNHSKLKVAFDSRQSCLFFYNPTLGHAACTWFETSSMTELNDLPFTDVKEVDFPIDEIFYADGASSGSEPQDYVATEDLRDAGNHPDFDGDRIKRSIWLQNHPNLSGLGAGTDWKPKLFVPSEDRDRKIVDHDGSATRQGTYSQVDFPRRTLLDIIGRTHFTEQTGSGVNGTTLDCTERTSIGTDAHSVKAARSYIGAHIYVIEDTDQSNIGNSSQIVSCAANGSNTRFTLATAIKCSGGAKLCISPVFVELTAHQLGVQMKTARGMMEQENVHNLKQVDDLKVHMLDVSGQPITLGNTGAKFQGIVYSSNSDTPSNKAVPEKPDGTSVASLTDGNSLYPAVFGSDSTFSGVQGPLGFTLTPGIRIFCSDVDFRLQSFRCNGMVLDTESSQAYTQS